MSPNHKKIMIALAVVALVVVVLWLSLSSSAQQQSQSQSQSQVQSQSQSQVQAQAAPSNVPTLATGTSLFTLAGSYGRGVSVNSYSNQIVQPSAQNNGFYLENTSNSTLSSVTLTLYNAYNDRSIYIYTINAEGDTQKNWYPYYQTTPLAGNRGYVGTYTIMCTVPPGGAFIVNTTNSNMGTVIISNATFV